MALENPEYGSSKFALITDPQDLPLRLFSGAVPVVLFPPGYDLPYQALLPYFSMPVVNQTSIVDDAASDIDLAPPPHLRSRRPAENVWCRSAGSCVANIPPADLQHQTNRTSCN